MLSNDESVREALESLRSYRNRGHDHIHDSYVKDRGAGTKEGLSANRGLDDDIDRAVVRLDSAPDIRNTTPGLQGTLAEALGDDAARVLERVVRPQARPALIVSGDDWDDPANVVLAERLNRNRDAIARAIRAVGRIEVRDHPLGFDYIGTGWLFDTDLIVTNRHVAVEFGTRSEDGSQFLFQVNPARRKRIRANIDFREERDASEQEEIEIAEILHIDDAIDVAFLKLAAPVQTRVPLRPGTVVNPRGTEVAAIGYPMLDARATPPDWLEQVFGGVYQVKRLMPGIIDHVSNDLYFHDCSTTGGASGSPLIDTATGQVIGLHAGAEASAAGFNFALPISAVQAVLNKVRASG